MRYCHNCGLSIGENAAFCPTCGAETPTVDLPPAGGKAVSFESQHTQICRLCGDANLASRQSRDGLCGRCQAALQGFVGELCQDGGSVPLSESRAAEERQRRQTFAAAIYSCRDDEHTCAACAQMNMQSTTDYELACSWTPNPECTNPQGCRCLTVFERESLTQSEVSAFIEYACQHHLRATAAAITQFHREIRREQSRRS